MGVWVCVGGGCMCGGGCVRVICVYLHWKVQISISSQKRDVNGSIILEL